jgi:hypothetical protein
LPSVQVLGLIGIRLQRPERASSSRAAPRVAFPARLLPRRHLPRLPFTAQRIEVFLDKPVADRSSLRFKENASPAKASALWQPIVDAALSLSSQLIDATDLGLKNAEVVKNAGQNFRGMIEATADANRERYNGFSELVESVT